MVPSETLPPSDAPRTGDAPSTARPPEPDSTPASGRGLGPGPTRVAVVGAGFIADFHLEILGGVEGVELVAVCDPVLERATSAARRFHVPHAVGSIAELPALGVQVAHVTVPPDLHVRVTRELLEQGIGAFVEKPLALSSADARELGSLARERGVPLAVNHNAVHHPSFAALLRRVEAGEIGRVEHVQVTLSVPLRQLDAGDYSHWMFRRPENIVFEQAPHPFAQVHALVGRVLSMDAIRLGTRELHPGQPFHDRWLLAARAERGTAEVYLAFGQDFTRSTLQVLGTDGSLEADLFHDHLAGERKTPWLDFWNSFLAGWRRGGALRRSARRVLFDWMKKTLGLGPRRDAFFVGMQDSMVAFHRALRAGAPLPAGADEGDAVLAWCEAAVKDVPQPSPQPPLPAPEDTPAPRDGEVVVIGATGFVGRATVRRLLERGLPVTAVVRRRHSLPPVIADGARDGSVRLVPGSLEDGDALAEAVRGARVVIHLATGGGDTWEAVERSMVRGSARLGEVCADQGVERMVYVSSTAALYLGHDCGSDVVGDDVPPDPRPEARPLYARGKIAAEEALMALHRERGLRVSIVRPAVVVGPGSPLQHSGLGLWARDNHCVGWGLGDRPCPLVLCEDVAEALVLLAQHDGDDLDGKALNLSSRVPLTAPEVVAAIRDATGRDLHFHPRSLLVSQSMEIGKWLVKKAGGRKDAAFPSYRDLKSRQLAPALACERAREVLGWRPTDDRGAFLRGLLDTPEGTDGERA